jgi:hypothetical protein
MRGLVVSMCILAGGAGVGIAPPATAQSPGGEPGWTVFSDDVGTRVDYPAALFSVDAGREEIGSGRRFTTRDGRARLSIYARPSEGHTPASYLAANFRGPRTELDYDRVTRHFFAVSLNQGSEILYRRCNLSATRGGTLHCIDLRYPRSEKRAWDATVTRISRSLRPLSS